MRAYWSGEVSIKSPEDYIAKLLAGASAKSAAGPIVTELTALTCSALWDGMVQISSDVAKLPLNLHKRRQDGGSDVFETSKTHKLLKYSPNPETRSMVFRRALTACALIYGNGYAEIVRDGMGKPAAFWFLHPNRVRPFYDKDTPGADGRKFPLRYDIDNGRQILDPSDILHIQGPSFDGAMGFNLVTIARQAIGLALAAQQFGASFFQNGTRFGGILTADQDLDSDQANDLRAEIEKFHGAADKAFRLLVLGAGFKFTELGVKPNDAQMKELRDQQIAEVARFLNMPLHKLKLNTPGAVSYSSVEMADLDYWKGPIMNWVTLTEEELNAKAIPSLELGLQFFKHNVNALLRGDIKSRFEALGIARDKGIINADEWREFEDWNPQPNGQGKLYLVQSAQIPVDKLAALADAQIEATKAKAQPPQPPSPPPQPEPTQQLAAAIARAEAAEQLAAEARADAAAAIEQRIALEATGTATAAELTHLRDSERQALLNATNLQVIADEIRRKADAQQEAARAEAERFAAERAALDTRASELQASLLALEHDAATATMRAQQAEETAAALRIEAEQLALTATSDQAARAEAERLATEAEARAAALQAEAEAQTAAAIEANRQVDALLIADAETRAALNAAQTKAELETAQRIAAETARDSADQARVAAETARDEWCADEQQLASRRAEGLEVQLTATQQQIAAVEAALATLRQERDVEATELRAALATLQQDRDTTEAARIDLEARLAAEAEARTAATATADVARLAADEVNATRERQRNAAMTSQRGQVADIMQRMIARETERARRHQATPAKFKAFIDAFYLEHREVCHKALIRAVTVHLALVGSEQDPGSFTEQIVQGHIDKSIADLRALAQADALEFPGLLSTTLDRWERERGDQIADRLLQEEMSHGR